MPNARGTLVLATTLLMGVGVLMVYSASITSRPTAQETAYLSRHLAALAIGVVAAVVAANLPARAWSVLATPLFVATCLLLAAVLVPGVGTRINGASRWFRFGSLSLQPSELAKIALVLFLARCLARRASFSAWARPGLGGRWARRNAGVAVGAEPGATTSLEEGPEPTVAYPEAFDEDEAQDSEDEFEEDDELDRDEAEDDEEDELAEDEDEYELQDEGVEENEPGEDRVDFEGSSHRTDDGNADDAKAKLGPPSAPSPAACSDTAGPLVPLLLAVFLTAALVVMEPDFGTAVFLTLVGLIVLFVGGASMKKLVLVGVAAALVAGFLLWQKPYRLLRITGVVAAWTDLAEAPYHVRQSLLTLGSGGLMGTGLGKGWQKLSFLPEPNTDFVFAVIGEELGLVGTLTVVALWAVFLLAGLRMVRRVAYDRFAYLAAYGLLVQLVLQAAINMAVVTALLPPKGIPLPLVSYGGSSLVVTLLAIGILISLCRAPAPPTGIRARVRFHVGSATAGIAGAPHASSERTAVRSRLP